MLPKPHHANNLSRKHRLRVALLASCVAGFSLASTTFAQLAPARVATTQPTFPTTAPALSQLQFPLNRRSLAVLGDPIVSTDAVIHAKKTTEWKQGQSNVLLLEGDVTISVGVYGFRGDRAVLRIDPQMSPGRTIKHLSAYIDNAKPLRGSGPVSMSAPRLFVTASTTGGLSLTTDALSHDSAAQDPLVIALDERVQNYLQTLAMGVSGSSPDPLVYGPQVDRLRIARRAEVMQEQDQRITQQIQKRTQEVLEQQAADHKEQTQRTASASGASGDKSMQAEPEDLLHMEQSADKTEHESKQPGAATAPAKHHKKPARDATQVAAADGTAAPVPTPHKSILPAGGVVHFSADKIVFDQNNMDEPYVVLIGHVRVMYDNSVADRTMTLQAENAVIFLAKDTLQSLAQKRAGASDLRGIYLEDNVIVTDGQYTARAPRVYFDPLVNKALMLDAVFFTYDPRAKIPLYVRAEKLRQESRTSFSAENAQITTSEFGQPHFAIGAGKITFEQSPAEAPAGNSENGSLASSQPATTQSAGATADGSNSSSRSGSGGGGSARGTSGGAGVDQWTYSAFGVSPIVENVPLMYWPSISGSAEDSALRSIQAGNSSRDGITMRSTWDTFGLLGQPKPTGVDSATHFDFLGKHGPGLGLDTQYDLPQMYGSFEGYFLPDDQGNDHIGGRSDVGHDGDTRGFFDWKNRNYLTPDKTWELSLEASYVSDPTFLEQFRRSQAETAKPFETSAYLKKQENDWALTFLVSENLDDFVPQTTTLQSPGYFVEKMPEVGYYREATSLWGDRLTYYTENRLSEMHIRPGKDTPADRGFTNAQSIEVFTMTAPSSFYDRAFASPAIFGFGLPNEYVTRADSRHEIQAPMKAGPLDITPYTVGRITAYSTQFDDYNAGNGNGDDTRLWGAVGTRFHTQVSRAYDRVEEPLLDLHRLRHIVEPSLDLFYAGTSVPESHLPVFDPEVESLAQGGGVVPALRNTLQTERGGPGRWRTVDWLVVNTGVVLRTNEQNNQISKLMPRYDSYRPEYSLGGDHFFTDAAWQITDTLSAIGALTHNMETDRLAQWRTGLNMRHSPQLSTFIDYTDLQIVDTKLLGFGFIYELTRKYSIAYRQTYDVNRQQSRSMQVNVERKLPRWKLVITLNHDNIDGTTSAFATLTPEGLGGGKSTQTLVSRIQE